MGNFITTRNGVNISLNIPAQITSFDSSEPQNFSSHVTRGKLKVFSIGKTGDYRVFTKSFAEDLVKSLPGTPVVAYYDEETDDFLGHNDEQYVYGYVPEDAVPEFVEEDGKVWAVVDINLFTERQDKIGEIANKIIGKAQSLELNPDTVDWELVYINNKLERIVFKKGSFYGLSVLGDNQQPAFEGAGFFSAEVIEQLKQFKVQSENDGGNLEMDKTDFLSLGVRDKFDKLASLVSEKQYFYDFCVVDFDEERIIVLGINEDGSYNYYGIDYKWTDNDNYFLGEYYEVIPAYVKKEQSSSNPSAFTTSEEENESSEQLENLEQVEEPENSEDESSNIEPAEEEAQPQEEEVSEENEDSLDEERDSDEQQQEDEQEAAEEQESQEDNSEEAPAISAASVTEAAVIEEIVAPQMTTSTLSDVERDELNVLRREKKVSLINSYREFLSEEVIEGFMKNIEDYDFNSLERELKIASFDANKKKFQEKEDSTFGIVLPAVSTNNSYNALDRLVAENI